MVKKLVFDPGHRNTPLDYGASGNGLKEAEIAMRIVNYAVEYLKANYTGYEVKLTRDSDSRVIALNDRDEVADNWGADVFVSVHLNAATTKAKGFETFIYNENPNAKTISLQNIMHNEILSAMKKFGDIQDRGNKRGNLAVLRSTDMPAILTENLFIDNAADARLLKNEEFIKAVGQAHARGVAKFLGLEGKVAAQVANKPDYVGHPAEKSIKKAIKTGVISGYDENTFKPDEPVTNARLAAILDRLGLLK